MIGEDENLNTDQHTGNTAMERQRQKLERCCHKPRKIWSHQEPEEARNDSLLQALEV